MGCAVLWLHPNSKRPINFEWTTGDRQTWDELRKQYREGYNVGCRLGSPSKLQGGYLAVIDVDVKSKEPHHRLEAVKATKDFLNEDCPVVESGRGGGSAHYYVTTPKVFKTFKAATSKEFVKVYMPSVEPSKKRDHITLTLEEIKKGMRIRAAWEISIMSQGSQVVVPPSIHPDSGRPYRWAREIGSTSLPVLTFDTVSPVTKESRDRQVSPVLQDFKVAPIELAWLPISDEVRDAIIWGTDVKDRSGFLLRASAALISAGLNRNEVLTVLTDDETYLGACAYEHAKTRSRHRAAEWVHRYTFKKVAAERSPSGIFTIGWEAPRKLTKEEMEAQAKEFEEERDWREDLDKTEKGFPRTTLRNLDLILSNRVEGTLFVEDLFASRIEYGCDTPWGGKSKTYIQDIDMILVKRWLAEVEGIEPNTNAILEATSLLAHRSRVHPVKEWLRSLKWDGKPRINTWIRNYCKGQAPEPYLSEVSRKFLVAMVKRVFEPGCQWDYVLILEGPQGKFKSSIARALASDRWFMDNLPDLKDKDSMLNLQGKWLIELAELADVKRADYSSVKAYLIRRSDTVRPHYGRLKMDVPRQSVFIGSINEGQYLKDPTGNRRYWPVKVGLCDVEALKAVRDQLFAEAMHIYLEGNEVLTLDKEATVQATEAQEERRVDDDESEMRDALISFINSENGKNFPFDRFKARDLMVGVNVPWGEWNGKGYIMNVAAHVLTRLGFERKKGRKGERFWRRHQPEAPLLGDATAAVIEDFF